MSEIGFSKEALIAKGQETGWDARKIVKTATAVMLIGGLVYLLGMYVLPFLLMTVWTGVKVAIGGVVLILLYFILKGLWDRIPLINAAIAKYTLGLLVEWDEFIIQEQQINQAEEDVEDVLTEKEKIEGEYVKLSQKIKKNQEEFQVNLRAAERAAKNGDNDQAEDFNLAAQRNQNYIETIGPLTDDMKFIITFSGEIYKVLKRKIKNAKADLEANKDIFYSAQRGAKMLENAKRAMIGDVELNSQADYAKEMVKQKIAYSIGQMRANMEILSTVTKEQNYKDKATLELAKERLHALNNSSLDGDKVIMPAQSVSFQNIKPIQKFGDIL